jgi:hypothetical protein
MNTITQEIGYATVNRHFRDDHIPPYVGHTVAVMRIKGPNALCFIDTGICAGQALWLAVENLTWVKE